MNLPRYPKYKPSGVDWLGEVPEHWEVKRLKMTAALVDRKTEADEECPLPYIGLENIEPWTGKLLPISEDVVPSGMANLFVAGNTLFGKLRPYLAKACNPTFDGLCSTELLVLQGRESDRRFLLFFLLSDGFIKQVDASTYGSKMPRANWDFIGNSRVPLPPLPEQRAIADFLDRETGRIDALIAKQGELIDRLKEKRAALITRAVTRGLDPAAKLKDSGVEWLGMVPEGWEVPPFYTRYKIELGKMLDEARITGDHLVPYLRNVDVQWDTINLEDLPEMDILPHEYERYTLRKGDLVVCEGGEVGRAAIFEEYADRIGFQKALHRLRPVNTEEVPRYTFYVLCAAAQLGVFVAEGNPNTIPHLTGEKLRRYRFPCPPLPEQRAIADYLDRETGKLDRLTGRITTAIERLKEYRAALITAAVTGKIDVREEAAKETT